MNIKSKYITDFMVVYRKVWYPILIESEFEKYPNVSFDDSIKRYMIRHLCNEYEY